MDMYQRIKSGEFDIPKEMPLKPERPQGLKLHYNTWKQTGSADDFNAAQKELQDYELAIAEWQQLRDEWDDEEYRAFMRFKTAALEDAGLANHPKAERLWMKAWEDGHACGHTEVYNHLLDLADIVL